MNILHIISSRGWGGAENSAAYLAKKQIEKGNSAFLFIHSLNDKLINILKTNNVPFYSAFNPERKNIYALNKIIKICRKKNIDIIHTHLGTGSYLGVIAGNFLKIPVAAAINIFSGYPYYAHADALCFDSNAVKDYHTTYFSSAKYLEYKPAFMEAAVNKLFKFSYKTVKNIDELKNKSHIIYERINESDFINYEGRLNEFDNYFNIGLTGRIDEQKGQIYFIEAAELLIKEYETLSGINSSVKPKIKPFMFHIVGSGKMENKLKRMTADKGISENFRFWGYQKDVRKFVNTFDVCVSCSLNEPFGINNLEYMFMKKPCIGTNTGGIPEVFGDTNIVISPEDPVQLKEAAKLYIENENFKNEQAAKGFERAKKLFASDICFKNVMDVYARLLDKN
jgi:glycosyltransferase involved in cell wall biosynthesis